MNFQDIKKKLLQEEGIPLSSNLTNQNWEEVILHLVPSWHINGTQYAQLNWPDIQVFTKKPKNLVPGFSKKVPSWNEKGTKLLAKKAYNLIRIMILTTEPALIEQLLSWMDYKNRQSYREIYLVLTRNALLFTIFFLIPVIRHCRLIWLRFFCSSRLRTT